MVDNSDGSYGVSYTPAEAGLYSVWVCVKAQHVQVTAVEPKQLCLKIITTTLLASLKDVSVILGLIFQQSVVSRDHLSC